MKHIQHCTEIKKKWKSGDNNCKLSLNELDVFIFLLYIWHALDGKRLLVDVLWSKKWEFGYFNKIASGKNY